MINKIIKFAVISIVIAFILLLFFILLFSKYIEGLLFCHGPSPYEIKKLQELRNVYGHEYEFKFRYDFYVCVIKKKDDNINKDEACRIVKYFFSEKDKIGTEIHHYYFNFFGNGDDEYFKFQIYLHNGECGFEYNRPYY